uniref:C2H2-type domain-containing protein n=1 Tax=Kryptolebias marmoratus TaxID=37003 RepID=A0A3Q3AT75_KRYMA
MVLIKQEAPEEWRPGVDQLDPEPLNIKQEKEEPWTSQEGDQLSVKEESDVSGFSVIAVCLKSEDDEEQPRFSQLHQHQVKDGDPPTSSSAGQMEAAADGEDSGGGQTTRNPDANTQKDDSSSSETELSEDYEDDDEVKSVKSRRKAQTEPESFKCNDCGKSFASKKYLNVHTRVHTGDKPFTCDFCGQRFSFKTNLNSHVKIHTGDKPLECNICEKRFSRKSHLNSHTRVHTGDKPFPSDGTVSL